MSVALRYRLCHVAGQEPAGTVADAMILINLLAIVIPKKLISTNLSTVDKKNLGIRQAENRACPVRYTAFDGCG